MAVPGGRVMAVMDHRRWCGTAERRRKRERREMESLTGGLYNFKRGVSPDVRACTRCF